MGISICESSVSLSWLYVLGNDICIWSADLLNATSFILYLALTLILYALCYFDGFMANCIISKLLDMPLFTPEVPQIPYGEEEADDGDSDGNHDHHHTLEVLFTAKLLGIA